METDNELCSESNDCPPIENDIIAIERDPETLTIANIPQNGGIVIGRLIWKSPIVKLKKQKNMETLHFTLMDLQGNEVTGTALGEMAIKYNEVLTQGVVYKFTNAVLQSKTVEESPFEFKLRYRLMNDWCNKIQLASRLANEDFELRLFQAIKPEVIESANFPDINYSIFTSDFEGIRNSRDVLSIVGLITSLPVEEYPHIFLTNSRGYIVRVSLSEDKLVEFGRHGFETSQIVGIHGVSKTMNFKPSTQSSPRAQFITFVDSVFIHEPPCEHKDHLATWRDKHVLTQKGSTSKASAFAVHASVNTSRKLRSQQLSEAIE